jgi:hypothetical protein
MIMRIDLHRMVERHDLEAAALSSTGREINEILHTWESNAVLLTLQRISDGTQLRGRVVGHEQRYKYVIFEEEGARCMIDPREYHFEIGE